MTRSLQASTMTRCRTMERNRFISVCIYFRMSPMTYTRLEIPKLADMGSQPQFRGC